MNFGYLVATVIVFSTLFIMIQRTEAKRRIIIIGFALFTGELLRQNAFNQDMHSETLIGFIFSLLIAFLFWVLIGRYNPVGSSDNIQVYGIDD